MATIRLQPPSLNTGASMEREAIAIKEAKKKAAKEKAAATRAAKKAEKAVTEKS